MVELVTSGFRPGAPIVGTAQLATGTGSVDALLVDFQNQSAEQSPMDFDIEIYPSDPMPGEAVTFRLVNITGIPAGLNPYLQTAVMADFGDPGTVYESGGGMDDNANRAMGRVAAHVYETAGSYTATFTMHAVGAAPHAKSITVTIAEPAVITGDFYIDFGEVSGAPDFSFAPAAGGIVQHVNSAAAFSALNMRAGNKVTRMTFKDGETFTDVSQDLRAQSTFILRRSGGGTKPHFAFSDLADPDTTVTAFNMGSNASRLVVIGLDVDGRFDPTTGVGPAGLRNVFFSYGDIDADRYISVWRCKGRGLRNFYNGGSPSNGLGNFTTHYRFVDNDFADWADYGIQWFGPHVAPCLVGNKLRQTPLAIQRSSQKANLPDGPDHGPTRIQHIRWGCDENNAKIGASGWSPLPPGYYIQPCNRYLTAAVDQQADWEMYIHRNKGVGSCFASIGSISAGNKIRVAPIAVVITHNEMDTGRQALGGFTELDCAGVHIGDNLHYRANVYDFNQNANYFIRYRDYGGVQHAVFDGDITCLANTIVSHRSENSGGHDDYSLLSDFDTWPGPLMLESDHNLVHASKHSNAAAFLDLSPSPALGGDGLRLLANDPLVGSVSDDLTVFDLALVPRLAQTSPGAYHNGAASFVDWLAPVNTSPPVIAPLAAFADEYGVSDIGAWDNVDPDKLHLMEYDWHLNGSPLTLGRDGGVDDQARAMVNPKLAPGSGTLSCTIIMTNRSGERVAMQSNTLTV